jgi:hypothetical protein
MLAYLFWHRPYAATTVKQYEEALLRFQQHLGQQHPASAAVPHSVLRPCPGSAIGPDTRIGACSTAPGRSIRLTLSLLLARC